MVFFFFLYVYYSQVQWLHTFEFPMKCLCFLVTTFELDNFSLNYFRKNVTIEFLLVKMFYENVHIQFKTWLFVILVSVSRTTVYTRGKEKVEFDFFFSIIISRYVAMGHPVPMCISCSFSRVQMKIVRKSTTLCRGTHETVATELHPTTSILIV